MVRSCDWKIVLIDDEEDIREVLTIALQDAGYDVQTAADGARASSPLKPSRLRLLSPISACPE